MASAIDILKSRFRGSFIIAVLGLAVTFMSINLALSYFDPSSCTPHLLKFGLSVSQKLGTDFLALLIFMWLLLFLVREDPKAEIASKSNRDATLAIDATLLTTKEFCYIGATGGYNADHRLPILTARSKNNKSAISISFILPHPFLSKSLAFVAKQVGDQLPDAAALRILAVAYRVLRARREAPTLSVAVFLVPHASTIRYDITDDLIAMSSSLEGNQFVLFPKHAPMHSELLADVLILKEVAVLRLSSSDASVRAAIASDEKLAQFVIDSLGAIEHGITVSALIAESEKALSTQKRPK